MVFNVHCDHAAFGEAERKAIYVNYLHAPQTDEQAEYIKHLYVRDGGYYRAELFENAPTRRMRMLSFLKRECFDAA